MTTDRYPQLYSEFRWKVPKYFNMAEVCCTRWANQADLIAIRYQDDQGIHRNVSFAELERDACRLANALRALGVRRGDRVGIVLPQRPETAVAHFACYKLGAVAMPLSVLFGPDALAFRLENSDTRLAIVDAQYLNNMRLAAGDQVRDVVVVDAPDAQDPLDNTLGFGEHHYSSLLARAKDSFKAVKTLADDPAVLVYTSGTTGPPKGSVTPHRAMIGNLTGFVASQNWFPLRRDVFWSPADWAWTGGLMDALMPSLYFGKPIVGHRGRFSPELAYDILERHKVTNAFLFPTALKQMMRLDPNPQTHITMKLRAIMSAGESVGETLFDWCEHALGVTPNEMFGQTEVNYLVGNSAPNWPAKAGSIGRPYPGHRVEVIDDAGKPLPPGEIGEVAVHQNDIHGHPDPVFFLGYWNNKKATREKFTGQWCRTGDLATTDEDGYLWYGGRADDMFKAAGYRIGPSEVENCLLGHPAVANVAVVPKPDAERGNLVKAYVVLTAEQRDQSKRGQQALIKTLQDQVRGKLAPYEYPKEIEFIDELPMTTTGKVQRRILRLQEEERAAHRAKKPVKPRK
ncbi:MAG: AMP-binding protein [Burkholderiaceae bacterium]